MKKWIITARNNDCTREQIFYCDCCETFATLCDWFEYNHPEWHMIKIKWESKGE